MDFSTRFVAEQQAADPWGVQGRDHEVLTLKERIGQQRAARGYGAA